jgi:aspartyl-tRNA(Asn)/glutamyl-tRNA(Gln) amidotransferase subunit B
VAEIDASLPPLPADRRAALAEAAGVSDADASLLVQRGQDALAVAAITAGADPARVLARVENDLVGEQSVGVAALVELIGMETAGELTATQAKQVLADMAETGRSATEIAVERGFEAMASDDLEVVVDQAIADNADEWARFCAGDDKERGKLTGFFVGQVMRATQGQADGKAVTALLRRRAD